MPEPDRLVTTDEAAESLTVSPRTMEKWRVTGNGPPFVRLPRGVRYRVSDLREWVEGVRRKTPTA